MDRSGRMSGFVLGLVTGAVLMAVLGATRAETEIPGAPQPDAAAPALMAPAVETPAVGRYQAVATSATMGSGLPWYGIWVLDTATGAVKWLDHPDAARRAGRYGTPFENLSAQPEKK